MEATFIPGIKPFHVFAPESDIICLVQNMELMQTNLSRSDDVVFKSNLSDISSCSTTDHNRLTFPARQQPSFVLVT